MTGLHFVPPRDPIYDPRVWRTNPAWCIEALLQLWEQNDADWLFLPDQLKALIEALEGQNIELPDHLLSGLSKRGAPVSPRPSPMCREGSGPGVVGLVVDRSDRWAWVVPLSVNAAQDWFVESTLPFRDPNVLQDLLVRLLGALGLSSARAVPERLAFAIRDRLGSHSDGRSMDIAAILAIVREVNHHPRLLSRACAVVEPDHERLVSVGSVACKLDAFVREYDRGTLLVRNSDCSESAKYDRFFDQVWEVGSLNDLAHRLESEKLLGEFLQHAALNGSDAGRALTRLHWLREEQLRYSDARNLLSRIENCSFGPDVSEQRRREVRKAYCDLSRQLGYDEEAERLARQEVRKQSQLRYAGSYDDQAQAEVDLAAAWYHLHRFSDVEEILEPWFRRLEQDPRNLTPLTRVKVFNTLARAKVILQGAGWEDLFRRSEEILSEFEPTDLPRTWAYLAHGLLRHGQLADALAVIDRIEDQPGLSTFSRRHLPFLRAEHARRQGSQWTKDEYEADPGELRPVGHLIAFYFQSTARQAGRAAEDAVSRFRRAFTWFTDDIPDDGSPNIRHFLSNCMRLGEAAWGDDPALWAESCDRLAWHLEPRSGSGLDTHYAEVFEWLGTRPDRVAAETFLGRVPFF